MPIAFYMDHHVPRAITLGLRLREVNVLTAYEDGTTEQDDAGLLDRAGEVERVLFTRDDDLLAEATKRQREGIPFRGIVYAHQLRVSIGRCVEDLELVAKAGEPADLMNQSCSYHSNTVSPCTYSIELRSFTLSIRSQRDCGLEV